SYGFKTTDEEITNGKMSSTARLKRLAHLIHQHHVVIVNNVVLRHFFPLATMNYARNNLSSIVRAIVQSEARFGSSSVVISKSVRPSSCSNGSTPCCRYHCFLSSHRCRYCGLLSIPRCSQ